MRDLFVFDLDETLVAGDTGMLWHEYLVEQAIVTDPEFLEEDRRLMALYSAGELDIDEYIRFSLTPLGDWPWEKVDRLVEDFISRKVAGLVYPDARQRLADIRASGDQILIISATVSFIVKPVARMLGVEQAIGIDLHQETQYLPRVRGTASFREGKVLRLQQWLAGQEQEYGLIHFYSDSINDRPLLEHADRANVVNPCQQLAQVASTQGWPVLRWALARP